MSYFTSLIFSLGLGIATVHTDYNQTALSSPLAAIDLNLKACFSKQYLSFSYANTRGSWPVSAWGQAFLQSKEYDLNLHQYALSVGGELMAWRRGTISLEASVSANSEAQVGVGAGVLFRRNFGNLTWKRSALGLSGHFSYWGGDQLEAYSDQQDALGDWLFSLRLSLDLPIWNKR